MLCQWMPILSLLISNVLCDLSTIRQTKNGPVEGIEQTSFFGKKFYSFRGIPYAEAPITGLDPYTGEKVDRRFKPPQPLGRRWTTPLKTQDYGYACFASTNYFPVENTNENCLFINIYVPAGGAKKKSVLAYIHGGAYTEGTTSNDFLYRPDFLIDPDNIVVTFNYRLGIYGFLNLGFGGITGNMGLKDQQLALQWIYENIEYFSGNRKQILLFGQSAGAASVNYQMLNKKSRKCFKRAFAISGSVFNHYALDERNHLERMQQISNIQDKQQLVEWLKTEDSVKLAEILKTNDLGRILLDTAWVPTIESAETDGAFLTKTPEEIYKSDDAPVMDTLFSFTSQEYITLNPDLVSSTEPLLGGDWKDSKMLLPFRGFDKDTYPEEYKQALDLLKDAYFSDTSNVDEIKRKNIALLTDSNFVYGILKAARYQVVANNKGKRKKTYISRFGVNADLNLLKILLQLNTDGATHTEDVCYIFRCGALDSSQTYENALQVRDDSNVNYRTVMRLIYMLTNFARTGNPSVKGDTPFKSSKSKHKMFGQDITNNPKSSRITDVLQQTHFDTWKKIDKTYKKLKYPACSAVTTN